MAHQYLIAVDIGTSGIKTLTVDQELITYSSGYKKIELIQNQELAELNLTDLEQKVIDSIKEQIQLHGQKITAIVFSCAMHSLIVLDIEFNPLTNIITWADRRSSLEAAQLRNTEVGMQLAKETGTPIHSMNPLTKLLWIRKQRNFPKPGFICGIKEYLIRKLTGRFVCDFSLASATGMMHLDHHTWHPQALELADITREQLPEIVEPTSRLRLLSNWAEKLGCSDGLSVIPGASDGCLANLGVGCLNNDAAVVTVGTSGAIRKTIIQKENPSPNDLFCYLLDEKYSIVGGPSNNGGNVIQRFIDKYGPSKDIESSMAVLSLATHFEQNLYFVPWMLGERAPLWTDNSKFGFTENPDCYSFEQLLLAVLEGLLFNIHWILEKLDPKNEIKQIYLTGGITKSNFPAQLLANITHRKVMIMNDQDASTLGAAKMGWRALGAVSGYEQFHMQNPKIAFSPQAEFITTLAQKFNRFKVLAFEEIDLTF